MNQNLSMLIIKQFINTPYATKSPAQKLDIYLPKGSGPYPVILVIHGGAWLVGDKDEGEIDMMLHALARGYAVVSMNYRLSPEAIFPAQIQDVKAAIRFIRAHAGEYGFDGGRICACGASAGGHLAALAGTTGGVAALEELSMGNEGYSSTVQAVVDWYGPTDLSAMDKQFNGLGIKGMVHDKPDSPESLLIGEYIQDAPKKVRAANPITYITSETPPFLIQHGTADTIVPYLQSVELYDALEKAIGKDRVELDILDGAGHGGQEFVSDENVCRVLDFIDKWLK